MKIKYRVVTGAEDLKEIVALQAVVWSMSVEDAVPDDLLHAVIHTGGVVVRADHDGQMVGFAMAMVGRRGKERLLWSHMAGVIPAYQGKGIGFGLKQEQRKWARKHGYKKMAWTFDPLQRRNANFNLHRLKAVGSIYHVDFYGEMTDGINQGMPSDRLEAFWHLSAEPVIAAAKGHPPPHPTTDFPPDAFLVAAAGGKPALNLPTTLSEPWYFIEIPYDVAALKRDDKPLALDWQLALRQAFALAFAQGYAAVDFVNTPEGRCWYILEKA